METRRYWLNCEMNKDEAAPYKNLTLRDLVSISHKIESDEINLEIAELMVEWRCPWQSMRYYIEEEAERLNQLLEVI